MCDDDETYPGTILCPNPVCEGTADDIGDDTRGRHYYKCWSCDGEWVLAFDDPALEGRLPETSTESQVYIDGGAAALRAYRRDA